MPCELATKAIESKALAKYIALAGEVQGQVAGVQGHEAAVGGVGVAQGVQQSRRLISGAAQAKEGNSGFPRKSVPPRRVYLPMPDMSCLYPVT